MSGISIFLCAPTNSGKTWVAFIGLYVGTDEGKIGVILEPTTTLVYQKEKELRWFFGSKVKILKLVGESRPDLLELRPKMKKGQQDRKSKKKPKERDRRVVLLCTYEAFRAFLFRIQKYELFDRKDIFGAIIVDEIHTIRDPSRGMKLETMIYKLKFEYFDNKKSRPLFCFLTGTFDRESAEYWSERFGSELLYYPSNRKFKFELHQKASDPPLDEITGLVRNFLRKYREVIKAKLLIFIKSREKAQEISDHLKEKFKGYNIEIFGFIHAGLATYEKKQIFDSFNSGKIKILSCSPILEAGVDVKDIEEIIIADPEKYSKIELEQIIGRCRELLGTIVHLMYYRDYQDFKKSVKFLDKNKTIFRGYTLEAINSQITIKDLPKIILEYLFLRQRSKAQIMEHLEKVLHPDKFVEYMFRVPFILSITFCIDVKPLDLILKSLMPDLVPVKNKELMKKNRNLIRDVKKKYALTYLGEGLVETQLNRKAFMQILDFFNQNEKPKSKEIILRIGEIIGESHAEEIISQYKGVISQEYIERENNKYKIIIQKYSQNKLKNKKFIKKNKYFGGDVEVCRKTGIWFFCSTYVIKAARLFHSIALGRKNYHDIDEKKILNLKENKPIFWRIRYIIERYNDDKDTIHFHVSKRTRRKKHGSSIYLDSIKEELGNSGKKGATIKELHHILKRKYNNIKKSAIWYQLDKISKDLEFSFDLIIKGRPSKRYYLAGMKPEEKERIFCQECEFFIANSIKVREDGPKSCCRKKQKRRLKNEPACIHFKYKSRNYHPFNKFNKDEQDKIICPNCRKSGTLRMPTKNKMYICNNCEVLIRYKKGGFVFYKGTNIGSDRISKYRGIYSVTIYGTKQLIHLGPGKKLSLERGEQFNLHIIKVDGRSYYTFEVYKLRLAGGEIFDEDLEFISKLNIEIEKLSDYEIEIQKQKAAEADKLRQAIQKAREEGKLFPIAWEMVISKIKSSIFYTLQLKKHKIFPKKVNLLVLRQLDYAITAYYIKEKILKESQGDNEKKFDEIIGKLRSIEANCDDEAWDGVKKALPPEDRFSSRQYQRHATTAIFYGARALDRYNVALNYLFFNLEKRASEALGKVGFSKYWPGRGILHYRSYGEGKSKPIESPENRELIYDFMDAYRVPLRFYLLLMFRASKFDETDINWKNSEWNERVFYIVGGKNDKLDGLFNRLFSFPFFYDHQIMPLSDIIDFEAKNLANYLLNDSEYGVFASFERRIETQQIQYQFEIINQIIKPGEKPEIEEIKDGEIIQELITKYRIGSYDYEMDYDGHVVRLNLNNLFLEKIPKIISNFSYLRVLDLSLNQISKIEELDDLTKLEVLNLHNNRISKISGLHKLFKLKRLNLGKNDIKIIENLGHLKHLQQFIVYGNQIKNISGLEDLSSLKKLDLSNNPLSKSDQIVYDHGVNAVIKYCKKIKVQGV